VPEPRWDIEPFLEDPTVYMAVLSPEETGSHSIFMTLMHGTECWHGDDRDAPDTSYLVAMDEASFREMIEAGVEVLRAHDARFQIN
jgi:hypothetical protein